MAKIQYAGEYILEVCEIFSSSGTVLDLKDQFAGVSIFEDIFKNALTGELAIVDTNNLLTNLPIIGQEKLRLRLVTPNETDDSGRAMAIDFTETPLYIYKIGNKTQVNDRTIAYTLSFTTPEAIRNNRIKVTQSFEGEPSEDMVKTIFRDEELLGSKKELYYEKTANNFKFVAPNMRPFDFINSVGRRCLSNDYNYSPTFLFYETIKGFWFRTIDSMMDRKNPRWTYREETPNLLPDGHKTPDAITNLHNILKYSVVSSTDVMMNMRRGMYGSNLIMIDLVNKTVENFNYNYFDDFKEDVHVDAYNRYASESAPLASEAKDDFDNRLSDYDQSTVYMQAVDRDSPNGLFSARHDGQFDYTGSDIWLQRRRGRFASLESAITLRIEVPGNTTLQAGDLIGIDMRNQGILAEEERDPYYSGRYLVKKLRHDFSRGDGAYKHTIHMEVIRDTTKTPYPSYGVPLKDGGNPLDEIIPMGSEDTGEVTY
jgi:hypothetical protein